jgi:RNA polymerase sigma-70 factor, ECF subfamily
MQRQRVASPQQKRAAAFERERTRLLGVAYRMLGRWAEAEDAVQEAWLRFADSKDVRDPAAWLTTVVARICLDVLRSARVRREAYVGPWLPEPLVTRMAAADEDGAAAGEGGDPAELVARTDEVGYALLVLLERLTPEQRVAFVLHDVFAVPFDEIATVLGTSAEAARQLATRARRAVASGPPRRRASRGEQRRAVSAFLAAARSGDLDGLLAVLAPDVTMTGDGGGVFPAGAPVNGGLAAARFAAGLFRRLQTDVEFEIEPVLINGDVGVVIEVRPRPDRELSFMEGIDLVRVVMAFEFGEDGRIVRIFDQLNPDKLGRLPALAELRVTG